MANGTPESEFSIECFQNYTASEVFIQGLAGMVDQNDVEMMIRAQKMMLQRFEKTNEMLTNCNALSASRLKLASAEFKKHTQLLLDMKKDLDYIFKKIRAIKTKLRNQYPDAFEAAENSVTTLVIDEDDDEEPESKANQSAMAKDVSKSTETLRPTNSQSFGEISQEQERRGQSQESTRQTSVSSDSKQSDTSSMPSVRAAVPPAEDKKIKKLKMKGTGETKSKTISSSDSSSSENSEDEHTSDTG